jgi:hypothetical protein
MDSGKINEKLVEVWNKSDVTFGGGVGELRGVGISGFFEGTVRGCWTRKHIITVN